MNEKEVEKYIDKLYELENYDVVKRIYLFRRSARQEMRTTGKMAFIVWWEILC